MEAEPEPGISDRYEKTSAWPLVVVFGLVLSEIGILFNLYPVAVGGLVMFVGSVAGIVNEADYVARPWRLLSALGVALVVVGLLVVSTQVDGGVSAYIAQAASNDQISQRGYTIGATGVVVAVAGLVLPRVLNQ
jgi:hypothetical protein